MGDATHSNHDHTHGERCGHTAIRHEGHIDYMHDGHLHHHEEGKVTEHSLSITARNAESCTPSHTCGGHDKGHVHSPSCGHERIPHGDHVDYLVRGHLHHPHDAHCDDHGTVQVV